MKEKTTTYQGKGNNHDIPKGGNSNKERQNSLSRTTAKEFSKEEGGNQFATRSDIFYR